MNNISGTYEELYNLMADIKRFVFSTTQLLDPESIVDILASQLQQSAFPERSSLWLVEGDLITEKAATGLVIPSDNRRSFALDSSRTLITLIRKQKIIWSVDPLEGDLLFPGFQSPTLFPIKRHHLAWGFIVIDGVTHNRRDNFQFLSQFISLLLDMTYSHQGVNDQNEELNDLTGVLFTQNEQLASLSRVGVQISVADSNELICRIIVSTAVNEFGAGRGALLLLDRGSNQLHCLSAIGLEGIEGGILEGEPCKEIINCIQNGRIAKYIDSSAPLRVAGNSIEEWGIFPLKVKNGVLGILVTDFAGQDISDILAMLVNYGAVAIDSLAQKREKEVNHELLEKKTGELAAVNEKLGLLSVTDELTGLSNRRYYQERIAMELSRANRYGSPLSLLVIDIDHFKSINDTLGHAAGDRVLKELAHRIAKHVRLSDLVVRYGGDELVVLLADTEQESAAIVAELIRKVTCEKPVDAGGELVTVTISVGVATFPSPSVKSGGELFKEADRALYLAKEGGRNRVVTADGKAFATERMQKAGQNVAQVSEALRESERKYRVLFEGSPLGIMGADIENRRLVFVNPRICRMFGYSEAEMLQLTIEELYPGEAMERVLSEFGSVALNEKNVFNSVPCLRKDGSVFYAEIASSTAVVEGQDCVVGFFTDVSERLQMHKEMEQQSLYLQEINSAMFALTEINVGVNRIITSLAKATTTEETCLLLIRAISEEFNIPRLIMGMPGRDGTFIVTGAHGFPDDTSSDDIWRRLQPEKMVPLLMKSGRRLWKNELDAASVDTTQLFADCSIWPLKGKRGVLGFLAIDDPGPEQGDLLAIFLNQAGAFLENVVLYEEMTRMNEDILAVNIKLRETDAQKSDFLNIVAHDLRTPLTSIRSYAELLLMYKDEPSEIREEFLGIISKESVRLGNLIGDFLDIARIESGSFKYNMKSVDLKGLITHALSVFQGEAFRKKITLESEVDPDLPEITGDDGRIGQMLANLLSNAVKFTTEGGRIKVEGRTNSGNVEISVADSGGGIDPKDQQMIFEKFGQVEDRGDGKVKGGTGLGLAITREIVEKHGGSVRVESELGCGARFVVTLPVIMVDDEKKQG